MLRVKSGVVLKKASLDTAVAYSVSSKRAPSLADWRPADLSHIEIDDLMKATGRG
jgi:hypothetical protein